MRAVLHEMGRFYRTWPQYARVLSYAWTEWRLLLLTVIGMLATTVVALARPWPMQVVVDSVFGSKPLPAWFETLAGQSSRQSVVIISALLILAALLASQGLAFGQDFVTTLVGQRIVFRLRRDLYDKLQQLTLRFYDGNRTADLVYRVSGEAEVLQLIVTFGLIPVVTETLMGLALVIATGLIDLRLGLAALATIPPVLLWGTWYADRLMGHSRALAAAESQLVTTATEALESVRVVKSFTGEGRELARFEDRAGTLRDAHVRVVATNTFGGIVARTVAGVAGLAALLFGTMLVLRQELQLGQLIVFAAYLQSLYGHVSQVVNAAMTWHRSAGSVERLLQVLDAEPERHQGGGLRPPAVSGRITYEQVSFGYDHRRLSVQDVSVELAPGQLVALVGPSGAGKTTLVSLLLGFYAPQQGRILLDGTDTALLDLSWLRQQVALVLQEAVLFAGTLADNIAYGAPTATHDQVIDASRAAGLHDFVCTLPQGYQTTVGERGVRLSSGQRQRVALARALLKNAPILVLDEPTSHLDPSSEAEIFETILGLAPGRLTLLVTHRLALAQRADWVVVLDKGRVVEQGTSAQLMSADGTYAHLLHAQTRHTRG